MDDGKRNHSRSGLGGACRCLSFRPGPSPSCSLISRVRRDCSRSSGRGSGRFRTRTPRSSGAPCRYRREIRTEGDSFFVVFEAPGAAVRAVVDAQRGLDRYRWPQGQTLRVRMGVHTGDGILGGGDYLARREPSRPDRCGGMGRTGCHLGRVARPRRARPSRGGGHPQPGRAPVEGSVPPRAPIRPGDRGPPPSSRRSGASRFPSAYRPRSPRSWVGKTRSPGRGRSSPRTGSSR